MSRFAFAAAPNINVLFVANSGPESFTEDTAAMCAEADLVVALGNVDLAALAGHLPEDKPSLCVLGGRDAERQPPAPFRVLHGGGVTFKDWRVAGLSGALRLGGGPGFTLSEEEAHTLLEEMPSCDLLISHAPPSGLAGGGVDRGFEALRAYVTDKEPVYHFHAVDGHEDTENIVGATFTAGVSGLLFPEPLKFL